MEKELENVKLDIDQLLKKRSELIEKREQEKIELVGSIDLSNLFSRLSYLALETKEEVVNVLGKRTNITNELANVNNALFTIIGELQNIRKTYLSKLDLIEKASGKKRIFLRGNKRVRVPEKSFKKYTRFYNATLEIDRLCNFINSLLKEKTSVTYNVAKGYVKNLSDVDKKNYYSSLAALIMSEDVSDPVNIDIHTSLSVDKKNADVLFECYKGWLDANKSIRKNRKKSSIKNSLKNKFTKAKNFVGSLFGRRKESGVNMALRKSIVAASLSIGVISSISSAVLNNLQNNINVSVSSDKDLSYEELSKISNFVVYENEFLGRNDEATLKLADSVKDSRTAQSIIRTSSNLKFGNDSMRNGLINLNKTGTSVYTAASLSASNAESLTPSLDECVQENAYEIKAVLQTDESDVLTASGSEEEMSGRSVASNDDLVIIQVATPTKVATDASVLESTTTPLEIESVVPVSAEALGNDPIRGVHLTFNNPTYDFNEYELKALYYVTNHESNGTYQDALGVISVVVNRVEDPRYPDDLISVLSAENQFVVWDEVLREISKYDDDDFVMNENIYNAMYDCLYRGIRNNDYVEFKASWTPDYSVTREYKVQIVEDGNKYHNVAVSLGRNSNDEESEILEDSEDTKKEDVKVLELNF